MLGNEGPGIPRTLLDQCISCGFCLPSCPTYQLTGDERSSPRGRIALMRAHQDGQLDDADVLEEASFCLGCRACEPVCPAGVQYGQMLEHWRDELWRGQRAPWKARLLMLAVRWTTPIRLAALIRRPARTTPGAGPHLMLGCAERLLFPQVSRAARRLCPELDARSAQGCCGALHAHNGRLEKASELARRLGEQLPGVIVTTSGGCAAYLAEQLGRDRVREISEHLSGITRPPSGSRRLRLTVQDSCHLRNGLDVWRQVRELLRQVGEFVELPDAASCCGSAGSYSVLRRRDSRRVLDRKLDQIEALDLDVVVALNPGCLRQLRQGLRRRRSSVRVLHLAEVLEDACDQPTRRERRGRAGRRPRL